MKFITSLLFLLLFFNATNSYSEIIKKINIDGLDTISRGTVLSYIPFEVNDELSERNIQDILNSLKDTNFFSKVSVNVSKDGFLEISVIENPTISYIELKGYSDGDILSQETIDEILINFRLTKGQIFDPKKLESLVKDLVNLYFVNGHYQAIVKPSTIIDSKNRIGIVIDISEGERALINSMKINGLSFFEEDELLDLFRIGEPDFFILNYFTEKDQFSKLEFDSGIEKIRSKYLNEGFLDIEIATSDTKYNKKQNKIDIVITLSEREIYKLKSIVFNNDLSSDEKKHLRSFFDIRSNDPFKRNLIVNGVKSVGDFYHNQGYAKARVSSKADILDDNLINVSILTNLFDKTYINRIVIEGNTRTQDDVIRRQLKLLEGQAYSKKELDDSIKSIKRLGYFSEVSYDLKFLNNLSDKADLIISVNESKTGEFSIGLSHSNDTGAAINAGISQSNILGTGNTLNARFSNSEAVEETSIYFKNPYFNNLGHSISYGFFTKSLDASNLSTSSYLIDENGFNFGYGIPLSTDSNIFAEFRLSTIDLTCGINLSTYESKECSSNDDLETLLTFSYNKNNLNDYFSPSEGTTTSITSLMALPFGDFQYIKLKFDKKSYFPVNERLTLKLAARTNFATSYGDDELPFYQRFFEGGTSSVRGFDFNSLGSKYPDNEPKGGEFSFVSSAGISSPVDFLGIDNANIKMFGFVDAGTISDKFSDVKVDDLRVSSGIGFNWNTPIGPLGMHLAKPIIKKNGDTLETFSFNLGAKF